MVELVLMIILNERLIVSVCIQNANNNLYVFIIYKFIINVWMCNIGWKLCSK